MQGLCASRCPVPEHSPSLWSVRPWGDTSTTVWAVQVATYKVCIIPSIVRTVADLWFVVDDLSAHFTHPMWTLGQWVIQQWSKPNESNQIHWMGAELFIKSKTEWGKMRCNRNHCQFGVHFKFRDLWNEKRTKTSVPIIETPCIHTKKSYFYFFVYIWLFHFQFCYIVVKLKWYEVTIFMRGHSPVLVCVLYCLPPIALQLVSNSLPKT